MPSITAIREAIATQLRLITALNVYSKIADSVMVPAAYVGQPEVVNYDQTFRAANFRFQIPVKVVTGNIQEDQAQELLDTFVSYEGANSVPLAIGLDINLSGTVQSSRVIEARNYGVYEIGGVSLLGVEFLIEVIA